METPNFSHYDVLGVNPNASQEEVKAAYSAAVSHPNVTSGPNAAQLMAVLNDAYSVLSNPERRRDYDAALAAGLPTSEPMEKPNELWQFYACDRCGGIDPYLRLAIFYRVWSILIYSQMKGDGGILCPNCRSNLAASTALSSAFLGPWGLPWGLIYTLRALFASVRGGKLPRQENANLLRHQGTAFLQRGSISEAKAAFTDSLKFEKVDSVANLLNDPLFHQAGASPGPGWLKGQTLAALLWLVPPVIVVLLFAWLSSGGSTYEASSSGSTRSSTCSDQSAAKVVTRLRTAKESLASGHDAQAILQARSIERSSSACIAAGENVDDFHYEHAVALFIQAQAQMASGDSRGLTAFMDATTEARQLADTTSDPDLQKLAKQLVSDAQYEMSEIRSSHPGQLIYAPPSSLPTTATSTPFTVSRAVGADSGTMQLESEAMAAGNACRNDSQHDTPDSNVITDCTRAITTTQDIEAQGVASGASQRDLDEMSLLLSMYLYARAGSERHSGNDAAANVDLANGLARIRRILAHNVLDPQDLQLARTALTAYQNSQP